MEGLFDAWQHILLHQLQTDGLSKVVKGVKILKRLVNQNTQDQLFQGILKNTNWYKNVLNSFLMSR